MLRRTVYAAICAACATLPLAGAPIGKAQAQGRIVDMLRVDCAQFDRLQTARKRSIGIWLHGYFIGTGQRPLLDIEGIEGAVDALITYCAANPEAPLVSAETATILRGEAPPVAATGSAGSFGSNSSGSSPRQGLRITVPPDTPRDPPRQESVEPGRSPFLPQAPIRPRPAD